LQQLEISEHHASISTKRYPITEPDPEPPILAPTIRQIRASSTFHGSQRSVKARNQRQRPQTRTQTQLWFSAYKQAREQASTRLLRGAIATQLQQVQRLLTAKGLTSSSSNGLRSYLPAMVASSCWSGSWGGGVSGGGRQGEEQHQQGAESNLNVTVATNCYALPLLI